MKKIYEPQKNEDDIYQRWEESGFFNPDICVEKGVTDKDADPFTVALPLPNVTGTLHMGHAVMLAIQDLMVRYHRMKGDKTLWIPGTDSAAIATQSKVEKILFDEEGTTRHDLGREKFLDKVNAFAAESHDVIVSQLKKMGSSLDWSREAFTLDKPRYKAVYTVFKKMYEDGLIYRGARTVNWDPKMQSNVSDDEIEYKEEKAPFYYFQYGPFVIATSRPETKFGDKYVVMHPKDTRYKKYKHGDTFECEWINGKITATIIKDDAIDMELGTGVMTITPWHDATDFGIAERYDLDKEQIIDLDGNLLPIAGEMAGLHIEEARPKIVEKLKEKGLLVKVDEDYEHSVATNYRGGGTIEPQISEQWFIDVNKEFKFRQSARNSIEGLKDGEIVTLKKLMQHTVRSGQINIIPERFEKIYFHWIDNLRDWCISRQIWYGHRIPVWYHDQICVPKAGSDKDFKKCVDTVISGTEPVCKFCDAKYTQDPDTLDTWFSAGIWTFSSLGYPDMDTPDLQAFHPTSVLETGYDILFFWVARMILMSTYVVGEIPFETVYLHGLVRDKKGRKMSKGLGNGIDPLDMIKDYGADATRLSLLVGSTPGNDMKLSVDKIAGYRNFANKLWNISRYILAQIDTDKDRLQIKQIPEAKSLADRWIISRLNEVVKEVTNDIEDYKFSAAGEKLRDFTWSELADWYLEISKIEENKSKILNYILNTVLKLWHPFMPFVTETIWKEVYGEKEMLMVVPWPRAQKNKKEETDFSIIKTIVASIRSLRAEYNVEPAKKIIIYTGKNKIVSENADIIRGLARVDQIKDLSDKQEGTVGFAESGIEVFIDLAGAVDMEKEKKRIQKEIDKVTPYVESLEKKLKNKKFTSSAPKAVVEVEQKKLEEAISKLEKLRSQLGFFS